MACTRANDKCFDLVKDSNGKLQCRNVLMLAVCKMGRIKC